MPRNRTSRSEAYEPIVTKAPVRLLELDSENPRLVSDGVRSRRQADLLQTLWTEMDVAELVDSIAENGFFQEEPLFVIPKRLGSDKGPYIVVEGNRRLAAVLILTNDEYREKLGATDVRTISEAAKAQLAELPISIYQTRQQLWAYLSFRHINSPRPWDAYSKARFIARVYEEYKVQLDEIAARTGDRHATVERLYRGFKVIQQAEAQGQFSVEDRWRNKFYFSHLYTALDYSEFQNFLGFTAEGSLRDNPVPRSKLENLDLVLLWLYGKRSGNIEPVVQKQNPDLGMLRDVLGKKSALAALRSGYGLKRAHEISIGDDRRFTDALTSAKEELQRARAVVTTGYDGDEELFHVIQDIQALAEALKNDMEQKRATRVKSR